MQWRRVKELVQHFWQRWLKEWLAYTDKRTKWFQEKKDILVRDIVVVSPETPHGKYITHTYPGEDGHIRIVNEQG